jgi:hypothetical protein
MMREGEECGDGPRVEGMRRERAAKGMIVDCLRYILAVGFKVDDPSSSCVPVIECLSD